jgi:hypothetical protein
MLTKCAACHHGMARPQLEDGGDGLQMCKVATKVVNKQLWTADKEWSTTLGSWAGANMLRNVAQGVGTHGLLAPLYRVQFTD